MLLPYSPTAVPTRGGCLGDLLLGFAGRTDRAGRAVSQTGHHGQHRPRTAAHEGVMVAWLPGQGPMGEREKGPMRSLVKMTGSRRKRRAMGSRLAARRSSPAVRLGAGRGPVSEGRGSYPWCCCGLGLGEVCGGSDPPGQECLCPFGAFGPSPQKNCPSLFPSPYLLLLFSSFLRAPDLAPFVWVRVAGLLGSWVLGCLPKHFLGKTAAISPPSLMLSFP